MDLTWRAHPAKRARVAQASSVEPEEREFVMSISTSGMQTNRPQEKKEALVIPLRQSNKAAADERSLDRQAEQEILADLSGKKSVRERDDGLVIKTEDQSTEASNGQKSLLMALIERHKGSDNDKGKLDLEAHALDLDFKSDVYESVPVEEFGAALLRGMGWKGNANSLEADNKIEQRQRRLGLGAAALPGQSAKASKGKDQPALPQDAHTSLCKGALVRIESGEHNGERGEIVVPLGVPGLNMIRLALEASGELVDVSRRAVKLLTKIELADRPFIRGATASALAPEAAKEEKEGDDDPLGMKAYWRDQQELKKATQGGDERYPKPKEDAPPAVRSWLRPGLRVKVVSKKVAGDAYLQKGTVLDVYKAGIATVRLDGGRLLDDVKEKYLETVLPLVGGLCMVLQGEYRGEAARMLGRNDKDQTASIELLESLDVLVVSMDDISASVSS